MELYLGSRLLFCFIVTLYISGAHSTKEELLVDTKISGLISAFGDFDSDRFTDVFYIADGGKALHLIKSHEKKPELRYWQNINCTFYDTEETIVGAIPGDFNGDAMMDVMVITQTTKSSRNFNIWIFKGDRISLDCNTTKDTAPLIRDATSQPLILDYNGDMVPDFIIETANCSRELWILTANKAPSVECPETLKSQYGMRFPNSNAFVNIQNCKEDTIDFNTDMFISGQEKMEYWYDDGGFNSNNIAIVAYPDESKYIIGQSIFIDLNIDGCIEHILPVCEKSGGGCDPQILWYNYPIKGWVKISEFYDDKNQTTLYFKETETLYNFNLPISVRLGDIDGDGYVDLISVMKSTKDDKSRAVILKNVPGAAPAKRKFILYWTSEALISDNVELASFLDVQENGKLDIIMTTRNTSGQYNILWIRNTFMDTSCFLKVLVTTGLCQTNDVCPNEKVPYGTNLPGPFVCYETSDVNGNPLKGCTTQLSQSSHFALQMPYSVFGLGETPNFVENVIASVPSGNMKQVRKSKWTQIVPDAQVVLIPYPPNETVYWICKLFYTPSSIVFSTLATLAVLCGVLIIIILILHRKEVLEDIAEHEEYKRIIQKR